MHVYVVSFPKVIVSKMASVAAVAANIDSEEEEMLEFYGKYFAATAGREGTLVGLLWRAF